MSGALAAASGPTAFVVDPGVVLWLVAGPAERGAGPGNRSAARKEDRS